LGIEGAEGVADRAILFEDFIGRLLDRDPTALPFKGDIGAVALHGHCHAKALSEPSRVVALLDRLPGASARSLETGCCGMAGAFGMLSDHRGLSHQVAEPLVRLIEGLPVGTRVVASGTSCRHQIGDLTDVRPVHIAELLAEGLEKPS